MYLSNELFCATASQGNLDKGDDWGQLMGCMNMSGLTAKTEELTSFPVTCGYDVLAGFISC